jgi:hypothetical protein
VQEVNWVGKDLDQPRELDNKVGAGGECADQRQYVEGVMAADEFLGEGTIDLVWLSKQDRGVGLEHRTSGDDVQVRLRQRENLTTELAASLTKSHSLGLELVPVDDVFGMKVFTSIADDVSVDVISELYIQLSVGIRPSRTLYTYRRVVEEGAMFGRSPRELDLVVPCCVLEWIRRTKGS